MAICRGRQKIVTPTQEAMLQFTYRQHHGVTMTTMTSIHNQMSAMMSMSLSKNTTSTFTSMLMLLLMTTALSSSAAFQFTSRDRIGVMEQHQRKIGKHQANDRRSSSSSWKITPLFAKVNNGPSSSSSPLPLTTPISTTTKRTIVSRGTIQKRRLRLLTKVLSKVSSPRLLQYLDTYHIRYPPTATRQDLERLLSSHIIAAKEGGRTTTTTTNNNNGGLSTIGRGGAPDLQMVDKRVVDAEVIRRDNDALQRMRMEDGEINDDEALPQQQQQPQRQRQVYPQSDPRSDGYDNMENKSYAQRGGSNTKRRRARELVWDDPSGEETNQPRRRHYHRPPSSSRQRDVPSERRRNYNLYATKEYHRDHGVSDRNVIDLDDDFRLDHRGEDPRNQVYENGLQIFLMGFYEAGKTATQLLTDAVVDAVIDGANGASESFVSGRWRYGEDVEENREGLGRHVVDADIINYSPRAVRESRRQRRRSRITRDDYYHNGVKSTGQRGGTGETRQDEHSLLYRADRLVSRRRRAAFEEGHIEKSLLPSETCILEGNNTVEYQSRRFSNRYGGGGGDDSISDSKRIYGLYAHRASQKQTERDNTKAEHHKRRWKDRLRRKFDDALGLHPPVSSQVSSKESYYDSWRNQMAGVDDSRKDTLRRRLNEYNNSSAVETPSTYRNNRRARMRGKSNSISTTTSSRQLDNKSLSRSRLDEVPFWRESGTIAALLFDNRRSPSRTTRYSRTLEQILLSPFGRGHTVTSLFLYISRSVLSVFGILCRWAGVRGTIPQPIVVTSVVAILVCSRRGQRMMSLALTILAMRLVAEFIHGSLHGNEFWDDAYDFSSHNWKEDNNALGYGD